LADKQLQLGQDDAYFAVQAAWDRALDSINQQDNKPWFESWVKTARPIALDGENITIGCTSGFAKHWLEKNGYIEQMKAALAPDLGFEPNLRLELIEAEEPPMMVEKLPTKPRSQPRVDEPVSQPMNPRYTFDTFVVGAGNRLAHACAMSVAENPGRTYNPLFIYGGAGLGKTHLMQAIGQQAMLINPSARVAYVSGETFTFHYVSALREHRTAEFRQKYRNIDLWLVDDIQFLVGKDRTEEEFFHTYNAIYDMGKQIVLSSDRAPKDLDLDRRLLSRFECGMLADIAPPDLETRMAIIETKAETDHMLLPNEVILYIAQLITSNIRQIEGALIKLHAYSSLMRASITPELAQQVLGEYFHENAAAVVDARKVQELVARRFDLDLTDLKGSCRRKDLVTPRQIAMYLTRELTDTSLPAIGRAFGGRDHTTVLHACKQVAAKLKSDRNLAMLIEELVRTIRAGKTCG
jgi:chromosomal replication initiator protein